MTDPMPVRVLIADDEPAMREVYRSLFDVSPGFEVIGEAGDASGAIDAARDLSPDVVLVDVRMPGGGETVVRALSERGVAVVAMSAHEEAGLRDRLEAAGAAAFVVKGSPLAELLGVLREAAAQPVTSPSDD